MEAITRNLFTGKQLLVPKYTLVEKQLRKQLIEKNISLLIVSYVKSELSEETKVQGEIFERLTSKLPTTTKPEFIYFTDLKQFDINIFFTCPSLKAILFCGTIPFIKGRVINIAEPATIYTRHILYYDGIEAIDKNGEMKKKMWNQLLACFK